jgi:predicted nuclease of restriction endonuclease-like (RecB) superfamily
MASTRAIAGLPRLKAEVLRLVEQSRHETARSVNAVMTATYWLIGQRIVAFEQGGKVRAAYGDRIISSLSEDLTARFGRGFSTRNLEQCRAFFLGWPIPQTASAELASHSRIPQTASAELASAAKPRTVHRSSDTLEVLTGIARHFPLPWSAYVRLLAVRDPTARAFYQSEALQGGWTVRQLGRQIDSMFYERTALSRNKAAMLLKGRKRKPTDGDDPRTALKDPFVLEFLGLRDEYRESDLEEALVVHLERFLLELGGEFAFIARQRRLRVGDQWFRVDLLLFHRRLRCLVIIDLKTGRFTHADAGQMHLYLNFAQEHWTMPGENPPVGLILCAQKDAAVARYALGNLPTRVMAAEYRTLLPPEALLTEELTRTRIDLETNPRRIREAIASYRV